MPLNNNMSLPIIPLAKYNVELPISKQKIDYRAFTVKEEKILLLAKESTVPKEMIAALCQVVDNCTFGLLDINKMNIPDLEFLFLQIRIKSVSEISELNYTCLNVVEDKKCGNVIPVSIDLSTIKPTEYDASAAKIKLTDKIGIQFRLPTVDDSIDIIMNIEAIKKTADIGLLYRILDFIWDEDTVTPKNEIAEAEFNEFIESLSSTNFKKLETFLKSLPILRYTIETKCSKCGKEAKTTLEGLDDFF